MLFFSPDRLDAGKQALTGRSSKSGQGTANCGSIGQALVDLRLRVPSVAQLLWDQCSRSPSGALLPSFVGEGSPTKIDKTEKSWYPYCDPSTGGPR